MYSSSSYGSIDGRYDTACRTAEKRQAQNRGGTMRKRSASVLVLLLAVGVALLLGSSGCSMVNRAMFMGALPDMPAPYRTSIEFKTTGDKTVDYEVLGEGFGQSSGVAVLLGLVYIAEPDAMAAYNQAVKSRGGDILLESRSQLVTSGILSPWIFTMATYKVWGLVAKIKQ
jgi:hypothetical protein